MPCSVPLGPQKSILPPTLIKAYRLEGIREDGTVLRLCVDDNHQRLVWHTVDWNIRSLRFIPLTTHGCDRFRLFSFEAI